MGIIRTDEAEIIKQCLTAVNFPASDKFFNLFQTHFTIQQVGARVSWRACFKIELELKEKFRGVLFYLTKSFSVNYSIFEKLLDVLFEMTKICSVNYFVRTSVVVMSRDEMGISLYCYGMVPESVGEQYS